MKLILKTILSLLLGLMLGFVLVIYAEDIYPNDFSRTEIILKTLEEGKNDRILVGNSILMNGIDANNIQGSCANLGSSGQNISETFLLCQELNKEVKSIYHFVDALDLIDNSRCNLSYQTIMNFVSYGYQITDFTKELIGNENSLMFENSSVYEKIKFQRSKFQASLSAFLKDIFSSNKALISTYSEIKAPYIYTVNLSEKKTNELLQRYGPKEEINKFNIDERTLMSIKKLKSKLNAEGIEYVLILQPINPRNKKYTSLFYKSVNEYLKNNIELTIQNFTHVLEASDFVDHNHPNAKGRIKFTQEFNRLTKN